MAARIVPGGEPDAGRRPDDDLRLSLPIAESSAGRVRNELRLYLAGKRVSDDVAGDIVLATDEACINAILHARTSGRLRVRAHMVGDRLRIEVRDSGRGFAPETVDVSKPIGPLAAHGRGLYLIAQLMDDVHIESHPGVGTVVEMLKTI